MIKYLFKSKTMLFGLALSIAGAVQTAMPYFEQIMTPTSYGIATSAIGLIVMILRAVTTEPIQNKA